MAGYLFTLDSLESLHFCAETGTYATRISPPKGRWGVPQEGTFADYATMKPGDGVYFFIKRKIYGVGRLVAVGPDCKYENYPGASNPQVLGPTDPASALLDQNENPADQRWICLFEPSPHFFQNGLDMDDALSSEPSAFRMLRAMWKLSFIKFDHEEDQAFRNVILKANELYLSGDSGVFDDKHIVNHESVRAKLATGARVELDAGAVLDAAAEGDTLRHEMAIEAGILAQLADGEESAQSAFGHWDYLSHQVIASPFKPIDYMDKMDLFGYHFLPKYEPTITRFLVGEVKRDTASSADVEQLMKYVDWVKDEYAHGDYGMIRAFLVAYDFDPTAIAAAEESGRRFFTVQRRPPVTREWTQLSLTEYRYDASVRRLRFAPTKSAPNQNRLVSF